MAKDVSQCLIDFQSQLKTKLSRKEKAYLQGTITKIIEDNLTNLNKAEADKAISKLLNDHIEAQKVLAAKSVANAIREKIITRDVTEDLVSGNWKDAPQEGFHALLTKSINARAKSRMGLEGDLLAEKAKASMALLSEANELGLTKLFSSKEFNPQYYEAKALKDKGDLKAFGKYPEAVRDAVNLLDKHSDMAITAYNENGGHLSKLEGFVMSNHVDPELLRAIGGKEVSASETAISYIRKLDGTKKEVPLTAEQNYRAVNETRFEIYAKRMMADLDWKKTLTDVPVSERVNVLRDIYQAQSNDFHLDPIDGPQSSTSALGSLASRFNHERILHFISPAKEAEYMKDFGYSDNILEAANSRIQKLTGDRVQMQHFGANPRKVLGDIISGTTRVLRDSGRIDKAMIFKEEADKMMKNLYPAITGELNDPVSKTVAKIGSVARNTTAVADLFGSIINQLTDPVVGAVMGNHRRATGFFEGMFGQINQFLEQAGATTLAEKQKLSGSLGLAWESSVTNWTEDFNAETPLGKLFKLGQTANFLKPWVNRNKLAAGVLIAEHYGNLVDNEFSKLPLDNQKELLQYGIDQQDWSVIRKQQLDSAPNGSKVLTGDVVAKASNADILSIPSVENKYRLLETEEAKNKFIDQSRDRLARKFRQLTSDQALSAITEPRADVNATLLRGMKSGTLEGEAIRSFALFKKFTVGLYQTHFSEYLHGTSEEVVSTPEAMRRMFMFMGKDGNPKAAASVGKLIAGTLFGGMVVNALRDIRDGKTMPDLKTPADAARFATRSLISGGGLPFLADILGTPNPFNSGPLASALLGPVWGEAENVTHTLKKVIQGEDAKAEIYKNAVHLIPGLNLVNSLPAALPYKYMIGYAITDMLNPGSVRRAEERLKKEKNQSYTDDWLGLGIDMRPSHYTKPIWDR